VDFSSTVIAFTNKESIIRKYNIIIKKLLVLKPLRLTNGIPTLLITDYFTTWISIGPYTEAMLFFVTKLSPTTLIILSMP
jgi:uncharacterized Fe-S cluster-containing MiaB family protein